MQVWRCDGATRPALLAPTEVETLFSDLTNARVKLGWSQPTTLRELI